MSSLLKRVPTFAEAVVTRPMRWSSTDGRRGRHVGLGPTRRPATTTPTASVSLNSGPFIFCEIARTESPSWVGTNASRSVNGSRRTRGSSHFASTSGSWLNLVESAKGHRRQAIQRRTFGSVSDLNTKIRGLINGSIDLCHFVWPKAPDDILKWSAVKPIRKPATRMGRCELVL